MVLGSCWGNLFSAVECDTEVVALTAQGAALVPIHKLVVGCKVLSMSPDGTLCWAKVTKTSSYWTDTPCGIILRYQGPWHTSTHAYDYDLYHLLTFGDHDHIVIVSPTQALAR